MRGIEPTAIMSKKKIAIDCRRAITDGVQKRIIIERVQDFYKLKYFKDSSKWNARQYPILKISNNDSIAGIMATAAALARKYDMKTIDWYDVVTDRDTMEKLAPSKEFNEELL